MFGRDKKSPSIIPAEYLHALAAAAAQGKFTMVVIINQATLDRLNRLEAGLLQLDEGKKGCIILLNEESIFAAYRRLRRGPQAGRPSTENGGGR